MTMAHILVHLDTREGLEEKITLHWRHYPRRQTWIMKVSHSDAEDATRLGIFTKIVHSSRHLLLQHPKERSIVVQKARLWMSSPQVRTVQRLRLGTLFSHPMLPRFCLSPHL